MSMVNLKNCLDNIKDKNGRNFFRGVVFTNLAGKTVTMKEILTHKSANHYEWSFHYDGLTFNETLIFKAHFNDRNAVVDAVIIEAKQFGMWAWECTVANEAKRIGSWLLEDLRIKELIVEARTLTIQGRSNWGFETASPTEREYYLPIIKANRKRIHDECERKYNELYLRFSPIVMQINKTDFVKAKSWTHGEYELRNEHNINLLEAAKKEYLEGVEQLQNILKAKYDHRFVTELPNK